MSSATGKTTKANDFWLGDQETHGSYSRCGQNHLDSYCMLVSRCFKCEQQGHYSRDYSQKQSRVCFICSQVDHVRTDFPLRTDGMVLDPKPLAW